ncbi:MAG: GNAT family N-acetyltransferase, partial [Myxococcota bacterium]|nr:GNAT family N-acetyltransferase [Myxococcota bacterium]
MTAPVEPVTVAEIALDDLAPGGRWHSRFFDLQSPWVDRGVRRWLRLVRPEVRRPVMAAGAWSERIPEQLVGTMIGVWHPSVLSRFDDLFEPGLEPDLPAADRPTDGCWHFISVTITPSWQGQGLGRRMVRAALERLAASTPDVTVRTLSPALGLADLLGSTDGTTVTRVVLLVAVVALPIVRFHCANGARLDAILAAS